MPEWYALLADACNATSRAEVARTLGVSRAAVSLLLSGKYPGNTECMAQRILTTLGSVTCPASRERVSREDCAAHKAAPMPTSSPAALRRWRACQHCTI